MTLYEALGIRPIIVLARSGRLAFQRWHVCSISSRNCRSVAFGCAIASTMNSIELTFSTNQGTSRCTGFFQRIQAIGMRLYPAHFGSLSMALTEFPVVFSGTTPS